MRQPNLTDTQKIQAHLEERYPEPRQKVFRDFALHLWGLFQKHNLQDRKFVKEFTSEKIETHIQRYSEMLFAWHFINLGYSPISKDEGPDLYIEHNGQRIWIEVVTPELPIPAGDSPEAQQAARSIKRYLAPDATTPRNLPARRVPSEQILLRWTHALREKRNQLLSYLEKEIVQAADPYLIAINSKLLGDFGFTGISQWPNPVEATFAMGPIEVRIDRQTHEIISSEPSYRPNLVNHNQANVPADTFLDSSYEEVSGIIATHVDLEAAIQPQPPSPLVVVHNPNATNPLPIGIFGAEEEYVAEDIGEEWEIRDIHAGN